MQSFRCFLLCQLCLACCSFFGLIGGGFAADKPAATLPDMPSQKIIAACDAMHYRHSEGSAIALADGRTLLVWSRFDGHKDKCGTLGDNGPATMVMAESKDGGKTWSDPVPLPVGTATRNIMQAAFVPVKDRLMLAFSVRMREAHANSKYAIESTDGGKTWSERRMLFDAGGANDRALRLSTGRIVIAAHKSNAGKIIGKERETTIHVAHSDDEGKTWKLSDALPHSPHAMESLEKNPHPLKVHEPTIAECADGSLLMITRSMAGVFYQSRSKDAGITWTTLEPTTIAAFPSPPYLRKLKDGRLALLYNPIAGDQKKLEQIELALKEHAPMPLGPRKVLALSISSDDGRTWSDSRTIAQDNKHGFCYPWVLEQKDGTLQVFCSRTPYTIYPCDLVQFEVKP